MAFTGRKVKGGRVLTEETVKNREQFFDLMKQIDKNNRDEHATLKEQMFWAMFEHLSHSSEKEFIDWAREVEEKAFFKK